MKYTFRSLLPWAVLVSLGALAAVAQGQQLSQNSAKQQPPTASSAPPEVENPSAPVVIDGRPILYLNAPIGGYTAADRAAAITGRILDLAKSGVPVESVQVEEREAWSEIRSGNDLIMAVSDLDAQARGRSRQQLAKGRIAGKISSERQGVGEKSDQVLNFRVVAVGDHEESRGEN